MNARSVQLSDEERAMENADRRNSRTDHETTDWRELTTARLDSLETAVTKNTGITAEIKKNTDDIVEFFEAGKGFFKVASYIGKIAKWVAAVAAAIGAIYAAMHIGQK